MIFETPVIASIEIDAPPAIVWRVLTDFEHYPDWNPFNVHMESSLEMGAAVRMRVALIPSWPQRQTEYITTLIPDEKICWSLNRPPPWLIGATRCQSLDLLEEDRTRYTTNDVTFGILSPLVMLVYGRAMQRGFDSVCTALKQRAEEVAAMQDRPPSER